MLEIITADSIYPVLTLLKYLRREVNRLSKRHLKMEPSRVESEVDHTLEVPSYSRGSPRVGDIVRDFRSEMPENKGC